MERHDLSAYQIRIYQLVFGGVFTFAAIMSVRGLMAGASMNAKLLAVLSIVTAIGLYLGERYWVIYAALFVSGIKIPGLPFSGQELACISIIGFHAIRQAARRHNPIKASWKTNLAIPIFVWICLVWFLNPTGLNLLGSDTVGARFYLQIVLGFVTFFVLSALRLNERDCKILFYTLLFSSVWAFINAQISHRIALEALEIEMGEGGSRYHLLGATTLYILMFARYGLREIFTSSWKFGTVAILAFLSVYTGKRRAFGTLVIIPYLRVFFTGKDGGWAVFASIMGALALSFAVIGDDVLWELPQSAKRAMSVVVPSYAERGVAGVHDLFRENVRRVGREVIRENPLFGRKGFAMDRSTMAWIVFSRTTDLYEGHGFSGNWHSTWYGFACDFGLPAMFMWALFLGPSLWWVYKGLKRRDVGEYSVAVYMYYAYLLFTSAIFSYTSGHAAQSSFGTWTTLGMLLAVLNGMNDSAENDASEEVLAG